jgi:hypothetical protein
MQEKVVQSIDIDDKISSNDVDIVSEYGVVLSQFFTNPDHMKLSATQSAYGDFIRIVISDAQSVENLPQIQIQIKTPIGGSYLSEEAKISISINHTLRSEGAIRKTEEKALVSALLFRLKSMPLGDKYLGLLDTITVHTDLQDSTLATYAGIYTKQKLGILADCEGKAPFNILLDMGRTETILDQDKKELTLQLAALREQLLFTPIVLTISHEKYFDITTLDIPDNLAFKVVSIGVLSSGQGSKCVMSAVYANINWQEKVRDSNLILAVGEITEFGKGIYSKSFRSDDKKDFTKPFLHILDGLTIQQSKAQCKLFDAEIANFKVRDFEYSHQISIPNTVRARHNRM